MVHVQIHAQVFHGRLANSRVHLVERRLVCELVRRKARLLMHLKRVDVLYRVGVHVMWNMRLESVKGSHLMTSIQGAF